jgi:hypothetical protein
VINEWHLEGEGMLVNDGLLYPNKIPSNFQGYAFKISKPHCKIPKVSHVNTFSKGYNFTPFSQSKHKTDTLLSKAIHESMKNLFLGSSEAVTGATPHRWAGKVNHKNM